MPLFKKKESQVEPQAMPASDLPTEVVIQLRQQGYSNNQITQYLTDQGYSSDQISDAMSQADIEKIGGPIQQEAPISEPKFEEIPPMPEAAINPVSPGITKEDVEEMAESIIEEKWTDLMKSVEKVIEWKELTEAKINRMEQAIKDLNAKFKELHEGVLERVSEYDKGIRQVGVNVKAMEEVFKKVLPQFTENVNTLSKITKQIKK